MTELFDTRGVNDDAEHWDALAERVARAAADRSRAGEAAFGGAIAASRTALVAASLLLAASLAFMAVSWRSASPRPAAAVGQAIAPSDDVGRAFALTGQPPAVAALLFGAPRGGAAQP